MMENKLYKHFVVTRFFNDDTMRLGKRVFDKDVLDKGIYLLKKIVFSSLNNQTDKNFEWIILIHENVNKEYIKPLYDLKADFPIHIILNEEYKKMLDACAKEYKYIINSRIDDDDAIYDGAVAFTHSFIDDKKPVRVITWKNGLTYVIGDNTLNAFNPDYNNKGGIGILLTTIIRCDYYDGFGIYGMNHKFLSEKLQKRYNLSYNPLVIDESESPKWIYVRHDLSDSKGGHRTNIAVDIDTKKIFGVNLW